MVYVGLYVKRKRKAFAVHRLKYTVIIYCCKIAPTKTEPSNKKVGFYFIYFLCFTFFRKCIAQRTTRTCITLKRESSHHSTPHDTCGNKTLGKSAFNGLQLC